MSMFPVPPGWIIFVAIMVAVVVVIWKLRKDEVKKCLTNKSAT